YFFYVSGVVLANASLDIAFHDTYYILYLFLTVLDKHLLEYSFGLLIYPILFIFYLFSLAERAERASSSENTKENNLLGSRIKINKFLEGKSETEIKNYIEQFFVGLLEGDGTITVDFFNNCKKRVRIFIALNNFEDNRFMLSLIAKYVGGRVVIERNNRYVTWYATSRTDIAKVFAILAKYPLLSTRKLCQLDFAKDFIDSNQDISEQEFIKLRNEKYKNQEIMLDYNDKNFGRSTPLANNSIHVSQFIIGQNYEKHLLKAILTYFNKENNKISFTLSKEGVIYYKIYIGGSEVRNLLASHFYSYPLLGDKNTKYQE
ncbi:homing endonuclease, partial [Tirmania nivea]